MHTFHSTHCTMQNFITPLTRSNTLRALLTKLSCDNIYPQCACTNKIFLQSRNTAHTMHAIIMHVHTMHQYYTCITQSTLRNAKFSACTHMPIFFRTMPNFSVRTHMPIFFNTTPNFSERTRMLIFFHATPNFSMRTYTPIFFRATPNFRARTRTPIFFYVAPNFSAHTRTTIFFHISQSFHCASCIFSAPTYTHSFLCASIPCEFHCRNWGFFLTFSQCLP
jgi:hypothetical protein